MIRQYRNHVTLFFCKPLSEVTYVGKTTLFEEKTAKNTIVELLNFQRQNK